MEILKFNISGKTAFFRNNEVNEENIIFSYGHLHKVALLGILGAILGLDGHSNNYIKDGSDGVHPQFYTKLKELKIAIVPKANKGSFNRFKVEGLNTCGYNYSTSKVSKNRSFSRGDNLLYVEQWLADVSWDIYILVDSIPMECRDQLIDYIFNNKAKFMPYLGKRNHGLFIKNVSIVQGELAEAGIMKIASFFKKRENVIINKRALSLNNSFSLNTYEYIEMLPSGYSEESVYYKTDLYVNSNKDFKVEKCDHLYNIEGKGFYFY